MSTNVPVYLQHRGDNRRRPHQSGNVNIYGALLGDTISVSGVYTANRLTPVAIPWRTVRYFPTIELQARPSLATRSCQIAATLRPPSAATGSPPLSTTPRTGSILLYTSTAAQPSAPTLSVSQDGGTSTADLPSPTTPPPSPIVEVTLSTLPMASTSPPMCRCHQARKRLLQVTAL